MKQSILARYILPFFQWYALLILLAITLDYLLHRYRLISVGRYLGYAGTFVVLISFVYSLRKRQTIESGSPRRLLLLHEYLAWTGSVLILVHAGIHFNAVLPWLAVVMLLIAVASGLIGKFLLKKSSDTLKDKRRELANRGINKEEADENLFLDSITVDLMKKWRAVHLPITLVLGLLVLTHIVTIVMFSK